MVAVTEFTPWASLIGGAMIGLSAVALMAVKGRIAGVSGIAARLFPPYRDSDVAGRIAFVAGLIVAPLLTVAVTGVVPVATISAGAPVLVMGGLLAGFGAVWGGGCTSGHGVCGLGRLSVRSLVAVVTFMITAALTVYVVRHIVGGA